ncbi:hypothetical protein K8S19_05970 [bacterium]|nr:hypothetical protein [bacterium]
MGTYKGSGVVANRDILREINPVLEEKLFELLTPEERKIYETAIPVAKFPAPVVAAIFEKSAAVVFPGDPQAVFKMGKKRAKIALHGIYKVFLKITTVPYLISKTTQLWSAFHDQGKMWVEKESEKKAIVFLSGYPELIPSFLETTAGFMAGAMEISGAKNVHIDIKTEQKDPWKWIVTWEE